MNQRKASAFIPAGMGALVAGIAIGQWNGGNYWHFAGGFLIGFSIVLLIGGLVKQKLASR